MILGRSPATNTRQPGLEQPPPQYPTGVYHGLNLALIAGSDVGQEPNSLLANLVLGMGEQGGEMREGVAVQNHLRLVIGAGHNVAHGSQSGRLHFHFPMAEQRNQLGHHAAINHHLDLLVAPISQITERPHGVH